MILHKLDCTAKCIEVFYPGWIAGIHGRAMMQKKIEFNLDAFLIVFCSVLNHSILPNGEAEKVVKHLLEILVMVPISALL